MARRVVKPPLQHHRWRSSASSAAREPYGPPANKQDPFDVTALEKSLNESATRVATIWLSFVVFSAYLAASISNVTHRQLFLEDPIKLPTFNIDVPLAASAILLPSVFVTYHVYLLLQIVLLARTAAVYNEALDRTNPNKANQARLRQRLPNTLFAQIFAGSPREREGVLGALLRLMSWVTLAIAPVLVLLIFEFKLLPYQSVLVTSTHRILIALDLLAVLLLWAGAVNARSDVSWGMLAENRYGLAAAAAVVALSVFILTFPGEPLANWVRHFDSGDQAHTPVECRLPRFLATIFPANFDRLALPRQTLIDADKLAKIETMAKEIPAQSKEKKPFETMGSFQGRSFNCATFNEADLRRTDFSNSKMLGVSMLDTQLDGAKLHGAHLAGAKLFFAKLQGADLGEAQLQNARLEAAQLQDAELEGANFRGAIFGNAGPAFAAQLQGAKLKRANFRDAKFGDGIQLQGADLEGANFQGANFGYSAQLQGAHLEGANFQGSSFGRSAQLQDADLMGVNLQGVSLVNAELQGAVFLGAQLQGADFTNTWLDGANFAGAHLEGMKLTAARLRAADLRDAYLQGADLSGADLSGAILQNSRLVGASLRQAHLDGAYFVRALLQGADLRQADLSGAFIYGTQLQGADFTGSRLTRAYFSHVFIWNARAANCDDAQVIEEPRTEPVVRMEYEGDTEKPAPATLEGIEKFIEQLIVGVPAAPARPITSSPACPTYSKSER